jgi:prepilin-type N-terminal cleavage/methylation domain-containing protein
MNQETGVLQTKNLFVRRIANRGYNFAFMKNKIEKIKNSNSGMTLVEMIIGISIVSILLGMISVFLIKAFYIDRYSYEQGLNIAALQNSLRSLATNLREAKQSDAGEYMFILADEFEVTFFANIDDDDATERVHYYLQGEELRMGISEASGFPLEYPVGDTETRTIGNGIVNTVSQPLFHYYNQQYPIDTTNNPLATPANPSEIGMVQVSVYANVDPLHSPDASHIETTVRPRNIR